MKKYLIITVILICTGLAFFVLSRNIGRSNLYGQVLPARQNDKVARKEIWVGANKIMVEIVSTPEARAKGLGGRDSLSEEQGMLFLFDQSDFCAFWMKDMKFAIDIIWIQSDKIIDITPNVPAPANAADFLPTYQPAERTDKVLEVNAGWAARHDVKIGDTVK